MRLHRLDDDLAAFARTRVNPAVAANPHSGECGYNGSDVAAFARTRVNPAVAANPHSGECGYIGIARMHLAHHEALEQASEESSRLLFLSRAARDRTRTPTPTARST